MFTFCNMNKFPNYEGYPRNMHIFEERWKWRHIHSSTENEVRAVLNEWCFTNQNMLKSSPQKEYFLHGNITRYSWNIVENGVKPNKPKPTNQPLLSLTDNLDLLILNMASLVLLWSLFLCPYSDRWLQVWLYHNQLLKRAGRGGPYIECWLQVWLYYDRFLKGAGSGVCIMHNQLWLVLELTGYLLQRISL